MKVVLFGTFPDTTQKRPIFLWNSKYLKNHFLKKFKSLGLGLGSNLFISFEISAQIFDCSLGPFILQTKPDYKTQRTKSFRPYVI